MKNLTLDNMKIGQIVNVKTIQKRNWQSVHFLTNAEILSINGECIRVRPTDDSERSQGSNPIYNGGHLYIGGYSFETI